MKLFQKHNVNPAAGCLPNILQIAMLFALYSVLNTFLNTKDIGGVTINTMFLGLDLSKPDHTFIWPVLAGVSQLILSLMVLPGAESHNLVPDNAKTKKLKEANKKEEDVQDMAESMQKQMVFMMPVITGIAAVRFPAGLAMYWVVSTVFSIAQQWIISGPGGLLLYSKQALSFVQKRVGLQTEKPESSHSKK
jgi:YidC/Oxa1 family membrane protein insertase